MNKKDKKLLEAFHNYEGKGQYVGTRQYWEGVFEDETNRDTKLHEAFRELHTSIVNQVIQFCKKHNLDVDQFSVGADGLLGSRDFGEWCPCTDSHMEMYIAVKNKKGEYYRVDTEKPFLFEI